MINGRKTSCIPKENTLIGRGGVFRLTFCTTSDLDNGMSILSSQ